MYRTALAAAGLIAVLDQLSKWWILAELMDPPRVISVTSFFALVLAWNRGVSFSLFSGQASPYIFAGVAVAIVVGLLFWLRRVDNRWVAVGIGLIIGGAIGNVIDRLRFGAVVDFLYLHAGNFYWPAFNLADSAITIGVGILIIDSFLDRGRRKGNPTGDGREA
ncbi:MAG: signal peptidase II [Alphaproteobacteria bacterium]|nr:signal peptidase II [Alphaproteobacteria bacterium]